MVSTGFNRISCYEDQFLDCEFGLLNLRIKFLIKNIIKYEVEQSVRKTLEETWL